MHPCMQYSMRWFGSKTNHHYMSKSLMLNKSSELQNKLVKQDLYIKNLEKKIENDHRMTMNCITIYYQSCKFTTRASSTTVLRIVLLRSGKINTKLLHRNRVSNFVGTLQLSDGAYSYIINRLKHMNCLEKQEHYISLPSEPSETIPMHTALHLGFQLN